MKLKLTALSLASLLCMAAAVSCGDEVSPSESVSINIEATTSDTTTTAESSDTETTTSDAKSTSTTKAGETTTKKADETAAADDETTTAADSDETTTTAAQQQTEAPTDAPAPEQPQANEEIVLSANDLFTDTNAMLAKLGDYESTSVAAACTQSGSDITTYVYKDIEIQSYNDGSGDRICGIKIKGGNYKTAEGIKIGSSKAEAEAAYGTDNTGYAMISNDMDLYITYSGDSVSVIEFCAVGI